MTIISQNYALGQSNAEAASLYDGEAVLVTVNQVAIPAYVNSTFTVPGSNPRNDSATFTLTAVRARKLVRQILDQLGDE